MTKHFTPPIHPKLGDPSQSYVYRDRTGSPVLVANRYDNPKGGKTYRPYDLARNAWTAPERRPLYNLDQILAAPLETLVIVVEGEKCADALIGLGFVATTVFGGCNGVKKADLSDLKNRTVVIWPDNDEPGEKYKNALKAALLSLGNTQVFSTKICPEMSGNARESHDMPTLSKGWDAADAVAEGWTRDAVESLVQSALVQPDNGTESSEAHGHLKDRMELWHTPENSAFATLSIENHREHWALDSAYFRYYLAFQHYQSEGKTLNQSALEDQRRALAGEALFNGREHPVFTRIGAVDGSLLLDLGDEDWSSVQIDTDGWKMIRHASARFQRSGSLRSLPAPVSGSGGINLLRPFLNVASDADFRMLVGWLVGCFQPKGPYPILILTGEQGSAKSTTARALRSLIDPAEPMTRSAPQSEQDLVIAAQHNHVLAFDNLSYIKPVIADALCRIATGGGFGTRKLHTNSEEVLFNATRPCLLNGIPDLANRPDLADRSIIVSLPVIGETQRQFEGEFWKDFERVAPHILAALLDAVSTALARVSSVTLTERPRMADFARWVTAAEPALGWPEGTFADAYATNRRAIDTAAIEGNPVAEAVLSLLADHGPWKGTATELIKVLRCRYPQLTDDAVIFPRQPNKLSGELKRVQPILRRQGIVLTKERIGTSGQRVLSIKHA